MITARVLQLLTAPLRPAISIHKSPVKTDIQRVVLVHGIFENGCAFDSLRHRLESHGIECLVPSLRPANGTAPLNQLAENLQQEIDQAFGSSAKIAVVAFSMGGLISRYYLQRLGGAKRCPLFITVSSPHHGTWAAHLLPFPGVKQMRPASDFIRDLDSQAKTLENTEIISYHTPWDLIILPPRSSHWALATNRIFHIALHPLMLHSRRVLNQIEKDLTLRPLAES